MQEYLYIQKDNCQHDLGGFFYVIYAHKFDVKFLRHLISLSENRDSWRVPAELAVVE